MALLKKSVFFFLLVPVLTACGSGGSESSTSTPSAVAARSALEGVSSAEVGGEVPQNGTRPAESICTPGTFARVSSSDSSCPSEKFRIFEDSGFLAEEGFTDGSALYFHEPGVEDFEAPSVKDNALSLTFVNVGGEENSICAMFCLDGNQTVRVFCTAPGKIVCDTTDYVRVADEVSAESSSEDAAAEAQPDGSEEASESNEEDTSIISLFNVED